MKLTITLLLIFLSLTSKSQQLHAISVNLFDHCVGGQRTLMDGTAILFNERWSDTVDMDDARKLTNPLENIAVLRNNVLLAIEKRITKDTVPIVLCRMNRTIHEFEIILRAVKNVFLEDIELNRIIPVINDTLRYVFTVAISGTLKRFRLLFHNTPHTATVEDRPIKAVLFPNPAPGGYVNIQLQNAASGRYSISFIGYNQTKVYQLLHVSNAVEKIHTSLPPGNYCVIIDNGMGNRITRQLIIQQ